MPEYLKTKAFFNEARVQEVEAQIKFDWRRSQTLWYGLRFSPRSQIVFFYPAWFCLRRILFAIILVYGPANHPSIWSIHLLIVMSLMELAFLVTYKPWKESHINKLAVANELIFLLICTCLLLLAPGAYEPLERMFGRAVS